jgi:Mg2+ and Co2+ transporter CorA
VSELKEIKQLAFDLQLTTNLTPKQMKILNNKILRPLYALADKPAKVDKKKVSKMNKEYDQLEARLEEVEADNTELQDTYEASLAEKDEQINNLAGHVLTLEEELVVANTLLESKKRIIDQFVKPKNTVKS